MQLVLVWYWPDWLHKYFCTCLCGYISRALILTKMFQMSVKYIYMVSHVTCCLKPILFSEFKKIPIQHWRSVFKLSTGYMFGFWKGLSSKLQIIHIFLLKWTCSLKNVVATAMRALKSHRRVQVDLHKSWSHLQTFMGVDLSIRVVVFYVSFSHWVVWVFPCCWRGSKDRGRPGTFIHLLLHCRLLGICPFHCLIRTNRQFVKRQLFGH